MKIKDYLQLARPANLVTAVSDIIAGIAIAGFYTGGSAYQEVGKVVLLCLATIGLYGGGIVFNDVFDADVDAVERPERAIPSGRVSLQQASLYGSILFAAGILAAFSVNTISGGLAVAITLLALLYNKWGKHHNFLGPLNMGLCRGGNLLLGVSIIPAALEATWWLGAVPVIYIAAITMVSRGEVHGGDQKTLWFAGFLFLLVDGFQLFVSWQSGFVLLALTFVAIHLYFVLKPLFTAIRQPSGPNIGKAVNSGVLGLIIMDAVWVSAGGNYLLAAAVLLLLPVSIWLARQFAVT